MQQQLQALTDNARTTLTVAIFKEVIVITKKDCSHTRLGKQVGKSADYQVLPWIGERKSPLGV